VDNAVRCSFILQFRRVSALTVCAGGGGVPRSVRLSGCGCRSGEAIIEAATTSISRRVIVLSLLRRRLPTDRPTLQQPTVIRPTAQRVPSNALLPACSPAGTADSR